MKTISSFYDVLGVGPSADPETIRKAYRRLARKHHPDVSSAPDAHENMARINEAFMTLNDDARRSEYNAMLAGGTFEVPSEGARRRQPKEPVTVKLTSRLKAHRTPIYTLAFLPDSGKLISCGFDNEVILWSPDLEHVEKRTHIDGGAISVIKGFPQNTFIAAGSAESIVSFWKSENGKIDSWRAASEEWVSCLAISPDGSSLATGSLHRQLSVLNTADGSRRYCREEHADSVTAVAWSANGKYLASGSADATVKLYHASSGTVIHTFRQIRSTVTAIALSADNRFLAVAAVDLSIRVFRMKDGMLEKMMYGHTRPVEALAFHPNGWLIASGSRDGSVGLWNAAKGLGNVRIEASNRPISSLAFSQNGQSLAAAGQDKLVRIWSVSAKDAAAESEAA